MCLKHQRWWWWWWWWWWLYFALTLPTHGGVSWVPAPPLSLTQARAALPITAAEQKEKGETHIVP